MAKDTNPTFLSCLNCIHLGDLENPICSAVKAMQSFKTQWQEEYPNVKVPDTWYDVAKFCSDYTPKVDIKTYGNNNEDLK